MGWTVDDIEATAAELRSRGVVFEEYDIPGLTTVNGIAEIAGQLSEQGVRRESGVVPRQRRQRAGYRAADSLSQVAASATGTASILAGTCLCHGVPA